MSRARWERMATIIGAVAKQALADRGLSRVALLDDGSDQAALAASLLQHVLDVRGVERVTVAVDEVESLLPFHPGASREGMAAELRRLRARMGGALPAHPASKTELVLGGELPPEPLLPLGDLWATDVVELGAAWSAPDEVRQLAKAAGGIEKLDAALRALVDRRDPAGLDDLPLTARVDVARRVAAGAASRRYPRIVPKVGSRTIGTDYFE